MAHEGGNSGLLPRFRVRCELASGFCARPAIARSAVLVLPALRGTARAARATRAARARGPASAAVACFLLFLFVFLRRRFGVHGRFRDLRQELIRFLLFLERLLEQLRHALIPERLRQRPRGTVGGDFVMLNFLRGANDGGILGGLFKILFQQLFAFGDDAGHALASLAGFLAELAEDFLKASDVLLRDRQVLLEGLPQLRRGALLDHLRQCFENLLFGIIEIFHFIGEQLLQRLHMQPPQARAGKDVRKNLSEVYGAALRDESPAENENGVCPGGED